MSKYPDMRDLARLATEDYSRIDSLDAIRPPYPAQGTPNWWALRHRYETLLMAKIRRSRNGEGPTDDDASFEAAKWAALGNEQADADYKGFVPSAGEVYDRQKRKDWLDGQIDAMSKRVA